MYNDDNRFNLYLAQITDAFLRDPVGTKEVINRCMDNVNYEKQKNSNMINVDKYAHILLLIFVCIGILALGLFNLEEFPMYAFGFVFFVAGMLVGTFVPGFGAIFLVSHGLTGLGLMIGALNIEDYTTILSDTPKFYGFILFILVVGLFAGGVFFTIIHSLGKLKDKKYGVCYSFICFFLLILVLLTIPQIVRFLNWVL